MFIIFIYLTVLNYTVSTFKFINSFVINSTSTFKQLFIIDYKR